jgi:hypothetical protein
MTFSSKIVANWIFVIRFSSEMSIVSSFYETLEKGLQKCDLQFFFKFLRDKIDPNLQKIVFGYCYHSVNVFTLSLSQSYHIKRLPL